MQIAHAIQSVGFLADIRESAIVYPVIMTTHLVCIAVFGGMILMTDLRLLGVAMTGRTVTEVVNQFRTWKRVGFVIMVAMGILLAASEAEKYTPNPYFWTKLTLLALVFVHALIFRPLVYNNTKAIDAAPSLPGPAKMAGALSLLLWLGVLTMGRLIGYWEGPGSQGKPAKPAAVVSRPVVVQLADRR